MTTPKENAIDFIRKLPDNLSVEEIAYKLYVNDKINKAQEQIREGKYISHEEAKEKMKKWLS
jgi:hypothetical protein